MFGKRSRSSYRCSPRLRWSTTPRWRPRCRGSWTRSSPASPPTGSTSATRPRTLTPSTARSSATSPPCPVRRAPRLRVARRRPRSAPGPPPRRAVDPRRGHRPAGVRLLSGAGGPADGRDRPAARGGHVARAGRLLRRLRARGGAGDRGLTVHRDACRRSRLGSVPSPVVSCTSRSCSTTGTALGVHPQTRLGGRSPEILDLHSPSCRPARPATMGSRPSPATSAAGRSERESPTAAGDHGLRRRHRPRARPNRGAGRDDRARPEDVGGMGLGGGL